MRLPLGHSCRRKYLEVWQEKKIHLTPADAEALYSDYREGWDGVSERFSELIEFITSGPIAVLVLQHLQGGAIERLKAAAERIRQNLSEGGMQVDVIRNVVATSDSKWDALREMEFFFGYIDDLPVEQTFAMIKPDAVAAGAVDAIITEIVRSGFIIVKREQRRLEQAAVELHHDEHKEKPFYPTLVQFVSGEAGAVLLCLEARGAIERWRLLCGPTNSEEARKRGKTTLRARFGTDGTRNAVHGSDSLISAHRELSIHFPEGSTALQRTLAIIKPDAVAAGNLVSILRDIESAGFTVIKRKNVHLSQVRAEGFYEEHRGKPFFRNLVRFMTSGPSIVMVLYRREAIGAWRSLMGPTNSREARKNAPHTIRAKYGSDQTRNACHGSDSLASAQREVSFFFPEMWADPLPDESEIRDFMYRKGCAASQGLMSLPRDASKGITMEASLQQFITQAVVALCQDARPKGLGAVKWISDWMLLHNPNKPVVAEPHVEVAEGAPPPPRDPAAAVFKNPAAPDNYKGVFVGSGVSAEGAVYTVEEPGADVQPARPIVVEVDADAVPEFVEANFSKPPVVTFVLGGPASGKGTCCERLAKELGIIHLSSGDLLRAEVASGSALGVDLQTKMSAGQLVDDATVMKLIKNAMLNHQDVNRFLLDGFPRALNQALEFERTIGEATSILFIDTPDETMVSRMTERAKTSGRADDNPETLKKRLATYHEQTFPVTDYYAGTGRVCRVDGTESIDQVYATAKSYFTPRVISVLAAPGAASLGLMDRLGHLGYACINTDELVIEFGSKGTPESRNAVAQLQRGERVSCEVLCPLVLQAIRRVQADGFMQIAITNFPSTVEERDAMESRIACDLKVVFLDSTRTEAVELANLAHRETGQGSQFVMETQVTAIFSKETQDFVADMDKRSKLARVPCSVKSIHPGKAQIIKNIAERVFVDMKKQVLPAATLVLGPPASGRSTFSKSWVARTPNSIHIDAAELLDKELERKTMLGLQMEEMLVKGQVVPARFMVAAVRRVLFATGAAHVVLESLPTSLDQIDSVESGFNVERAFSFDPDGRGLAKCKERNARAKNAKVTDGEFDVAAQRIAAVAAHYATIGRLLSVPLQENSSQADVVEMVASSTRPSFFAVCGAPCTGKTVQCDLLSKKLGFPAITTQIVVQEAFGKGGKLADELQACPDKSSPPYNLVLDALQAFISARSAAAFVLDDMIVDSQQLAMFDDIFGPPMQLVRLHVPDELLEPRASARAGDAGEFDSESFEAQVKDKIAKLDTVDKARWTVVDGCGGTPAEDSDEFVQLHPRRMEAVVQSLKKLLRPKVHAFLLPMVNYDIGRAIGREVCNVGRGSKLIMVDGVARVAERSGKGSAQFPAGSKISLAIWETVLKEAFSSNPLGSYVVVNYFAHEHTGFPTVRDQRDLLESLATVESFVTVGVSKEQIAKHSKLPHAETVQAAAAHSVTRQMLRLECQPYEMNPQSSVLMLPLPPKNEEPLEPPTYADKDCSSFASMAAIVAKDFVAHRLK